MSWTYSLAFSTDKDKVRLIIEDTDSTVPLLQDEEIEYFLSTEANVFMAASRCAEVLGGLFNRKADKQVGDLKLAWKATSANYLQLAKRMAARGRIHQVPSAGGIRVSDQEKYENDTSIRHNSIRRGIHDYTAQPTLPNTEGS